MPDRVGKCPPALSRLPRAMLFDLCGTVVDSMPHDRAVLDQVAFEFGRTGYSELRKLKNRECSIRSNFEIFFPVRYAEAYERYIALLLATIPATSLFVGFDTLVAFCRSLGIRLGVLSNRPRIYTLSSLAFHRLADAFDSIVCAHDDLDCEKPHAKIVRHALHSMSIEKAAREDILIVGDSFVDVKCADNADCDAVLFAARLSSYELPDLEKRLGDPSLPVVRVLRSHAALLALLTDTVE